MKNDKLNLKSFFGIVNGLLKSENAEMIKIMDRLIVCYFKNGLSDCNDTVENIIINAGKIFNRCLRKKDVEILHKLNGQLKSLDKIDLASYFACFVVDFSKHTLFLLPDIAQYMECNKAELLPKAKKEYKKYESGHGELIRADTILGRCIKKWILGFDTIYFTSNYKFITSEIGEGYNL